MASRKRRHFPESFKRQAVERVSTSGLAIRRVAEELGAHETVLRRGMPRFAEPGTLTGRGLRGAPSRRRRARPRRTSPRRTPA